MNNPLAPSPERPSRVDEDRARWENIRRLAINAFTNVTWEQAQEYFKGAFEAVQAFAEYSTGYSENTFAQHINWHILQTNEAYSSALKEFFREHQPEPEIQPQQKTPDTETERSEVRQGKNRWEAQKKAWQELKQRCQQAFAVLRGDAIAFSVERALELLLHDSDIEQERQDRE